MINRDVVASSLVTFFVELILWPPPNYVSHFVFLRDVWIRTQRATVASRRATNLATHLPKSGNFVMEPWFHTTAFVGCALLGCFRSCHIFVKTNCQLNKFPIWSSFMEKQQPLSEIHSQVIFATKLVLKIHLLCTKTHIKVKGKIWYGYKIIKCKITSKF